MEIRIFWEHAGASLYPAELASEVVARGFVVFCSGRTRQRALAREVSALLEDCDLALREGETGSANGCMCIVDTDRHEYDEIVALAAHFDDALWREEGESVSDA